MAATENIVITCSRAEAEDVRDAIDASEGGQAQLVARKNFDGSVPSWIVAATLATQALPHLLSFLKDMVRTKRVEKIVFGDIEIVNPSPEDLEKLRALISAKLETPLGRPHG
jgi:hypothetical protein